MLGIVGFSQAFDKVVVSAAGSVAVFIFSANFFCSQ